MGYSPWGLEESDTTGLLTHTEFTRKSHTKYASLAQGLAELKATESQQTQEKLFTSHQLPQNRK